MRLLLAQILFIITFPHTLSQKGEAYFTPSLPAPGEDATLHCSFISSPNRTFLSALPNFFIQSVTVGIAAIRNRYTVNGVDLSRYTASISSSSTTGYIRANITLYDVTMRDEGIKLGCSAQTTFIYSLTKILSINVSEPPHHVDTLRSTPLDPRTCLTTLSWDDPSSDRDIASYHIMRDLTTIHTNPPHLLSYNVTERHPMGEARSYVVVPESVAGRPSGPLPGLRIYLPQFQFGEITLRVENGVENFLNWTTKENFSDPLTVSYRLDLDLVGEEVTKHSYAFFRDTDENRYAFSGVDGSQFVVRLSAYKLCDQTIASRISVNEQDTEVRAGSQDLVWIVTGSGAAFLFLCIVILGALSLTCCFPRRRAITRI